MSLTPLTRAWHLTVFSSFALAQPLFEVLGRSPEFFIIHRAAALELLLFAIGLIITPPVFMLIVEMLASLISRKLVPFVHALFIFILASIGVMPFISRLFESQGSIALYAITIAIGVMICALYLRAQVFRTFLLYLSPAVFIFAALFLYNARFFEMISAGSQHLGKAVGVSKDVPVILVIFDEFPLTPLLDSTGKVDPIRFPGFAELASTSTWYRNGTSVTAWTERAVPVILSGLNPDPNIRQMPSLLYYPQNIFTLLSESHEFRAYEQVTHLCPDNLCKESATRDTLIERLQSLFADSTVVLLHAVLPAPLKKNLPDISFAWGDFWGTGGDRKQRVKANGKGLLKKGNWADDLWLFDRFLEAIKQRESAPTSKPGLYMIHITFPHVPYRYLPSGKKYIREMDRRNDKGFKKIWSDKDWPTIQGLQRFLMQAVVADRSIASLTLTLKEQGIFDKSLIVVTADHGSTFQPSQASRRVNEKTFMDVMPVPLFLKYPGQKSAEISDRNVETPDVLPTILDVLNLKPSNPFDGQSALSTSAEKEEKLCYLLENKTDVLRFPKKLSLEPTFSRLRTLFKDGPIDNLYDIGPAQSFHGLSIEQAIAKGARKIEASIDNRADFERVNLDSEFLPAFVTGSLPAITTGYGALAIALNDKIVATTWVDDSPPARGEFSAMIPEREFTNGKNNVTVLSLPN